MKADRAAAERRLAVGTVVVLGLLAAPIAAFGAMAAGTAGAVSALIGLGFVALLFGLSAWLMVWSVGRSADSALGMVLGGVVTRLLLYAAALTGLAELSWVHRPSLALATAAAFVITLGFELVTLARSPQLFMIDADAGRPEAVPHATRS